MDLARKSCRLGRLPLRECLFRYVDEVTEYMAGFVGETLGSKRQVDTPSLVYKVV